MEKYLSRFVAKIMGVNQTRITSNVFKVSLGKTPKIDDLDRINDAINSGKSIFVYGKSGRQRITNLILNFVNIFPSLAISGDLYWQDLGVLRAMKLSQPDYSSIKQMGIIPQLIIIEPKSKAEALAAIEWTKLLGISVVCLAEESTKLKSDDVLHICKSFDLSVICDTNS